MFITNLVFTDESNKKKEYNMLKVFIFIGMIVLVLGCENISSKKIVKNVQELNNAIHAAEAGDKIVMANGIWKDIQIKFYGKGEENKTITLKAEIPGKVSIEGKSSLKIGGEYLIVDGLYFKNGYTPNNAVIDFRISNDSIANNCRVTNCVIEEFNQPNRYNPDHWIEFWGRHNQLDHCYIAGKFNQGPTIRVFLSGNEHINNYHQITNNYFGPRPRKGGPKAETMQIGASNTSMVPSYVKVANNLFERCNGEVEIISSKSNFNEFRNNIFLESEGSLVMRHGNYCIVDGNIFIGNDESKFIGGIRVINTGHWVTNNYFYKLRSDEFRAPLAIMNGIPKSPLNRYNQVTDVVVAYNSWIDCITPWQLSVGANMNKKDVLPAREIRSARPKRIVVANNLIYNHEMDKLPLKSYDKIDGVLFKNNVMDNQDGNFKYAGIEQKKLTIEPKSDWLYEPKFDDALESDYFGFGFEDIQTDLFGANRSNKNLVGAIVKDVPESFYKIDKNKYGTNWFSTEKRVVKPKAHDVSSTNVDLSQIVADANSGDILEFVAGTFQLKKSLIIDKKLIFKSKDKNDQVQIVYSGDENSALFEMHPQGNLLIENISLSGKMKQYAFAPLKENMSYSYNLKIDNCIFQNFKNILIAYRGSFADSISMSNSTFKKCINGIELAAETDDKGDYNAEFLTINNCTFENIQKNVLNFYRGGYDESTIGGNLMVDNSTFKNCGSKEASKILLKTRGIINVELINNTFQNNPVKLIALLWGEKNNQHNGNEIISSGKIRVDQYLKQKLVY